ncbi:MAG: DUF885 domain-containing protein [Candidatus Aminicenantes bacterium]|nr:MAG: DUF885 domain-containing protein [Candidatus Aminicenantes bacterium]
MKTKSSKTFLWLFLGILVIVITSSSCQKGTTNPSTELTSRFHSIVEKYWNQKQADNPFQDILEGKNIKTLPDISIDKARKNAAFAEVIMKELLTINSVELSHKDWINYEILRWQLDNEIIAPKYYWYGFLIPPVSGYISYILRAYTGYTFQMHEDLESYLDLLEQYPAFIRTAQALTKEQLKKGIILSKEMFTMVSPFLKYLLVKGDRSPLYVKENRLSAVEENEAAAFQKSVENYIDTEVHSALQDYTEFISDEYYDQAPDAVGLWQYPGGKDYYTYLIKVNTTLDLSPEEIHQIGLDEVNRIEAKIEAIKESLGFEGTLAEFRKFLKTDEQFFPKTPEEIEKKLMSYVELMDAHIPEYFSVVPKAPYGVKRLAAELEGSMTFGYYQQPTVQDPKGYYMYNGSKLNERSLLMAEALIYHELVPGHHFHIASQIENEEIPEFRKYFLPNAFNEGWAEYAAWLGLEMGLFEDPYSLIGRHMLDMMLATRLVVDTGMNYLGWPRSKAVEFMREHMIESETQIYTESLRYSIRTPAQALGYKLGSIKMMGFRAKAEKELGDRFDIKKFHQAVLGYGAMPLFLLEKHIDRFIQQEKDMSVNQ